MKNVIECRQSPESGRSARTFTRPRREHRHNGDRDAVQFQPGRGDPL